MEPSKANTGGDSKKFSFPVYNSWDLAILPSVFRIIFFPQNGKDNKSSHPLLLELPYLKIKPKTQTQQAKKWYPITSATYLPGPYTYMGLSPPPPPTLRRLHVSRGKQTWIGTTNAGLFMNFLLLHVAFVIYWNIFKFKHIKWFISFLVTCHGKFHVFHKSDSRWSRD